jgi:large subunit ribosomal protein L34
MLRLTQRLSTRSFFIQSRSFFSLSLNESTCTPLNCTSVSTPSLSKPLLSVSIPTPSVPLPFSLSNISINDPLTIDNNRDLDMDIEIDNSIECVKRTFQPNFLRRKRKHGFLRRTKTTHGKQTLARRLIRGRKRLAA